MMYLDFSKKGLQDSFNKAEKFLVRVLDSRSTCSSFDSLRYKWYHLKLTSVRDLPCSSESIKLHILRAFYVTFNQKNILRHPPIFFGYNVMDDQFILQKNHNIYPSVEDLVSNCTCKKCSTKNCGCKSSGLKCILFSHCSQTQSCKNPFLI